MYELFFFFKQKTAKDFPACLVGSEMCIREGVNPAVIRAKIADRRFITLTSLHLLAASVFECVFRERVSTQSITFIRELSNTNSACSSVSDNV